MRKETRTFDAKRTRIGAKKGPKTAFCMALRRSLEAEKALAGEPRGGLDELRTPSEPQDGPAGEQGPSVEVL